jgi:hypothetical protein
MSLHGGLLQGWPGATPGSLAEDGDPAFLKLQYEQRQILLHRSIVMDTWFILPDGRVGLRSMDLR